MFALQRQKAHEEPSSALVGVLVHFMCLSIFCVMRMQIASAIANIFSFTTAGSSKA